MGNAFFNAPIGSDDSKFVLWHLLVIVGGLWVAKIIRDSVVYRYRNILNGSSAKRMLAERNDKKFEFKLVKGDELKNMDVH